MEYSFLLIVFSGIIIAFIFLYCFMRSIHVIGPTEVGLVIKLISLKKIKDDNPIAFKGEAGYQAALLMPGLRFKLHPIYKVKKFPWVQVPAGEIGVVISQVGKPLETGAKSAYYKNEMGNFSDFKKFMENGGGKGVQRPVLPPGTLAPFHPVAFLVITKRQVYGIPVDKEIDSKKSVTCESFGLDHEQLDLVMIKPFKDIDSVGIVTVYEGQPLEAGDIANRLGGFEDILSYEKDTQVTDAELIEKLLEPKNHLHNNYQNFQNFLDHGGRIGLQHDPLLYGAYVLNPFLVSVEIVPMLMVKQGEVAVIKSYVGLVTEDMSGEGFKFGSLVRPGHRGIWQESLRTGKYPINPRCYQAEIVPTSILTLNWADAVSKAHNLDGQLSQIIAKSQEGFVFKIDLQVQIHVPDKHAPKVISMVGTMQNLVSEVLQAAVGNHFRDKLQSMPAIEFIKKRQNIQIAAYEHIENKLQDYHIETRGVYIQDVILPQDLVKVLTEREIANQEIATFEMQEKSQKQRIEMEKTKGTADMQSQLANSEVEIQIKQNNALARKSEADGEATYISKIGEAKSVQIRATGLANAEAYQKQVDALGREFTSLVNIFTALSNGQLKLPEVLSIGGNAANIDGLLGVLTSMFKNKTDIKTNESIEEHDGKTDDKKNPIN